ncbi:MAG: hypothetical protein LC776_14540, partial [Acidobacteria bacterium]|nr:hypothetical protein [Acidobacteriota bacterium]
RRARPDERGGGVRPEQTWNELSAAQADGAGRGGVSAFRADPVIPRHQADQHQPNTNPRKGDTENGGLLSHGGTGAGTHTLTSPRME